MLKIKEKKVNLYLQLVFLIEKETYLIVWIGEISDNDGDQVSGKSCWEVGPTLV